LHTFTNHHAYVMLTCLTLSIHKFNIDTT